MNIDTVSPIADQTKLVLSHMQKLHGLKFKSMRSSGQKAEYALECTVAILLGCILEIDSSLLEISTSLQLRRRLYNLKEEIDSAPKDGVGFGKT